MPAATTRGNHKACIIHLLHTRANLSVTYRSQRYRGPDLVIINQPLPAEPKVHSPVSIGFPCLLIVLISETFLGRHLLPNTGLLLVEMADPQPVEHVCDEGSQTQGNEDFVAPMVCGIRLALDAKMGRRTHNTARRPCGRSDYRRWHPIERQYCK